MEIHRLICESDVFNIFNITDYTNEKVDVFQ